MNELNSDKYEELFTKYLYHGLDGDEEPPKIYFSWINSQKYTEEQKSYIIKKILTKYNIADNAISNKIKKHLPKGFNKYYSIEDSEYEALKREFKI